MNATAAPVAAPARARTRRTLAELAVENRRGIAKQRAEKPALLTVSAFNSEV